MDISIPENNPMCGCRSDKFRRKKKKEAILEKLSMSFKPSLLFQERGSENCKYIGEEWGQTIFNKND